MKLDSRQSLLWNAAWVATLLVLPLVPYQNIASQLPNIFILAILTLGLNVVVGYTGLLHLGIGAFFGIGAYVCGILTVPGYPFQIGFWWATLAAMAAAATAGILLGAPTLRLRGDYLALVTLGFGEVVRFAIRNLEEITAGTRSLSPLPPPSLSWLGVPEKAWAMDYRPFYYLCLACLIVVMLLLRNLERSRLGRAWVAIREDQLAASCMGINTSRAKLAAFAIGAALAGLAGSLYAAKLTTTAGPDAYDFNLSIMMLACLILGGMGNIHGAVLGTLLLVGFDTILAPKIDIFLQQRHFNPQNLTVLKFASWRLMVFGLVLVVMMRFRPEGLLPSRRLKLELHEETP